VKFYQKLHYYKGELMNYLTFTPTHYTLINNQKWFVFEYKGSLCITSSYMENGNDIRVILKPDYIPTSTYQIIKPVGKVWTRHANTRLLDEQGNYVTDENGNYIYRSVTFSMLEKAPGEFVPLSMLLYTLDGTATDKCLEKVSALN
jgi:hypothetical protein